ncbi:MAG: terminase large subunit [Renibacterium salmoninarum]|nr:terminase large subunit [Renibacterium salmoninarum]
MTLAVSIGPKFATRPTPGAPHDAHAINVTAKALGTPLMPWQQLTARLVSERRVSDPRQFRFRVVVITVPRQSGKTTIMRAVLAQRALMLANRRAFYTAQTGKDASARWNDLVKQIELGPFRNHVKKRMAAGSQSLTFPNGSTISPFAPTAKSLHGYTPHDVMLDEIFTWDSAQGEELMGAIKPAQITLPDRQLWLVSTMGTAQSDFLNGWIDAGRASVDDPASDICYIEYSLDDDLDAYDPANWAFHPALGHTITIEDLTEAAAIHSPGEWNRAYMNRRMSSAETVFDLAKWDNLTAEQEPPPWSDVAVAYEVGRDRARSAIAGAWYDAAGIVNVRMIRSDTGADWLAREAAKIWVEDRPKAFGADDGGLTKGVTDTLRILPNPRTGAGVEVETLSPRDFATAWGSFKARVDDGTIRHEGSPALRAAIEHAVLRPLGEATALSRMKSTGPIPELVAAVVAVRLLEQSAAPEPAPMIWSA